MKNRYAALARGKDDADDEDEEERGTRPLEVEVVVVMRMTMVVKATLNRHACPLTHTQQGAMRSYGKERRTVVASIKS